MERHGPARRGIFAALVALLGALCAQAEPAPAARDLLERIERARAGLPSLCWDDRLAAAAALHAAEMSGRGEISHTGSGGEGAADRACRQGCTDARIGEILGAGPSAASVVAAWLASPEHRDVLRGGPWTHVGAGVAGGEQVKVYVVLFSTRLVEDLRVEGEGSPRLHGRLLASDAISPFLIVDLQGQMPILWERESGEFAFAFDPGWIGSCYVRLGYTSVAGGLEVTNILRAGTRLPGLDADVPP